MGTGIFVRLADIISEKVASKLTKAFLDESSLLMEKSADHISELVMRTKNIDIFSQKLSEKIFAQDNGQFLNGIDELSERTSVKLLESLTKKIKIQGKLSNEFNSDDVTWAFRTFLGRNPESQTVILSHLNSGSFKNLVRSITNSSEFKDRIKSNLREVEDVEFSLMLNKRIIDFLHMLSPMDAVGGEYIRLGRPHDGGYIMLKNLLKGGVAYSLGINKDVSWDKDMANIGYNVFQYDHTIENIPENHERFSFFKKGICGFGKDDEVFSSLDHLLDENGHIGYSDLVLKVDIEGAEWDVFSSIQNQTLSSFGQIAIEFHNLDRLSDERFFNQAYDAIKKISQLFVPIHIHGNNFNSFTVIGSTPIPKTLEVTYVRRDRIKLATCSRTFPTPLDQPNNPERADLQLGFFQF